MRISPFISSLLASPLLLALAPLADEVKLQPKEGSTLAKTFTLEADFELSDVSLDVSGQDMSGMVPGDFAFNGELVTQIADQYVKLGDGRLLELVREFKKSTSEWSAAEDSGSEEDVSELDGSKVRFKWNEGESRYEVSFAEGEGDAAKLEKLDIDMDYAALLPDKSVSEGDRWDVDAKGLAKVVFPGTAFEELSDMDTEGDEMAELAKAAILPQIEKLMNGLQAKCEYAGQREVDGASVGVIKLEIGVDDSLDLTELIQKAIEMQTAGMEVSLSIDEASVAVKAAGKGELLWDLAAVTRTRSSSRPTSRSRSRW